MNAINAITETTFSLFEAANTSDYGESVQRLSWRRDAANDPRPAAAVLAAISGASRQVAAIWRMNAKP